MTTIPAALRFFLFCLTLLFHPSVVAWAQQSSDSKPIRALLIAGGCCHDYAKQQEALCKGIQARANVRVDVYWTDNSTTSPILPLYSTLNWAEEYDVIIHDECAADIKDPVLINRILQVHQKIPAVHLHCAMHSFRLGTDAWFKHLGLQSTGHGPQEPIDIAFVDTNHPITKTLSNWTTINEELYNNVKLLGAHPLARGKQTVRKNGVEKIEDAVVAWTNEYQGVRSFSTTIGHNTETVADTRYLEMVTRGLLWACNQLNDEHLKPYQGDQKTIFIDKSKFSAPSASNLEKAPKDATLVKVTASSTQSGNWNYQAIDGNLQTRWCADGPSFPQWFQLEFEEPKSLENISIDWESPNQPYRFRVEGSMDGKSFETLVDQSKNTNAQSTDIAMVSKAAKFVRITGVGASGGWCSIREIRVRGDNIVKLWPADPKKKEFESLGSDPYSKSGNTVPRIERLSPEQEAEILKDVKVAEGFEATVFAAPPAVNYPVFVAASVDGTLYVSSDGNGSLGRNAMRGRVIRLKDSDGDGRADETKVFCEIDAPRGLVWDRDRLYVMHPPHLSAFIDRDGDGVAEEQKTLVKNLAFGYDKRPADHTTNGISMGPDGWLYIAGGDFGFIDAQGTDGRVLTHRGGGVIRVRTDGSGLELYSTGTRNILEVAISPQMDMFARDNTNDGGGWDVRLHHFTGSDDHGYPRLYKNFGDECVQPLADYGGGSGCGAVYIDEPGMGDWNNAPFTADWGTGAIYRHHVGSRGATFSETKKPEPLVRMTRPTDADVDGDSRIYCASWRGATFDWAGPNVGYIVCIKPKGFIPTPMLDHARATTEKLASELESPSYRRRMAAMSELTHRGDAGNALASKWLNQSIARRPADRNLLDTLQTTVTDEQRLAALGHDDALVVHTAIRSLAKNRSIDVCCRALAATKESSKSFRPLLQAMAMMHDAKTVASIGSNLEQSVAPERRRELIAALCRLHFVEGDWKGDSWGTRPDTRGPYYQPTEWSGSQAIRDMLKKVLHKATPEEAGYLIASMQRNRLETDTELERILTLAMTDDRLLPIAVEQLAKSSETSSSGLEILLRAVNHKESTASTLSSAIVSLSKSPSATSAQAMLTALEKLDSRQGENDQKSRALKAFRASPALDMVIGEWAANPSSPSDGNRWIDAALLAVAGRNNGSPESVAMARKSIAEGWKDPSRRKRLIEAAARSDDHWLDDEILTALDDPDADIARAAKQASERLRLKRRPADTSPKIGTLSAEESVKLAVETKGDLALGMRVFAKANCAMCHTVRQDEVQKGPYLGNIAKTYQRPELAVAVLEPSKTIAQGFITNLILTTDDVTLSGFITNEQNDRVTLRDQQGKEHLIMKTDISERKTSTISSMPTGVLNDYSLFELASLLDYLQSLAPNP
ncbi:MAG: discoidin domain-containing protein [Pirellula sp.]